MTVAFETGLSRSIHPSFRSDVQALQIALNRTLPSHLRLATDGKFGRLTEQALREFQRAQHLPGSGVLDQLTCERLRSSVSAVPMASTVATTVSTTPPEPARAATAGARLGTAQRPPVGEPQFPFTTLGDSIVVGIEASVRASAKRRLSFHSRFDGNNPEMVGKTTRYIESKLRSEVLPAVRAKGLRTLVLGGGTNDILRATTSQADADQLFLEVSQRLARNITTARAAGLKVVQLTLPPEGQFIERDPRFRNPEVRARAHALWQRLNTFISRDLAGATGADAIVNLSDILGHTERGVTSLKPEFRNRTDLLHPAPSGYAAAAAVVQRAVLSVER